MGYSADLLAYLMNSSHYLVEYLMITHNFGYPDLDGAARQYCTVYSSILKEPNFVGIATKWSTFVRFRFVAFLRFLKLAVIAI